MAETLDLEIAAICHRGRRRRSQEDMIALDDWTSREPMFVPRNLRLRLDRPVLLAVADGMGGAAKGQVASRMTIDHLVAQSRTLRTPDDVRWVIGEAHREVLRVGAETPRHAGMGSTVVGVLLRPEGLLWFNVGDSRLYRRRDGILRQLSIDDVPPDQRDLPAGTPRTSSVITAVIGGSLADRTLNPHVGMEALPADGGWLLCSDGLSDVVTIDQMEAAFDDRPVDTVLKLYDMAMRAGGPDNISIIVARLTPGQRAAPR